MKKENLIKKISDILFNKYNGCLEFETPLIMGGCCVVNNIKLDSKGVWAKENKDKVGGLHLNCFGNVELNKLLKIVTDMDKFQSERIANKLRELFPHTNKLALARFESFFEHFDADFVVLEEHFESGIFDTFDGMIDDVILTLIIPIVFELNCDLDGYAIAQELGYKYNAECGTVVLGNYIDTISNYKKMEMVIRDYLTKRYFNEL